MAASFLKSRQTKYTAYAGAYILVILAVLGAVNFLANRYDKSYDSTSNKQFSLSDQTIKVVGNLKNDVKLTYFDEASHFPQARDLLDRYTALSPKLHVEFIDPVKKPQQAKSAGYRRDVTILVDSGAAQGRGQEPHRRGSHRRHHPLPQIRRAQRLLRQRRQRALHRRRSRRRLLAHEAAAGARQLQDPHHRFQTQARRSPASRSPSARPRPPPPSKSPRTAWSSSSADRSSPIRQPIVDAFKKYVEGGGHALFMLDNAAEDRPRRIRRRKHRAGRNCSPIGASPRTRTWCSISAASATCSAPAPKSPSFSQYESHPITRPLARVPTAFPLPRSLDVKSGGKSTVEKLFGTTEDSIAVTEVAASGAIDPKKGKKGPFTLGAAGTLQGTPAGRFIVVGTSQWAENRAMGSRTLGNRDLFMNMINWLSADEDLISIRPKSTEDRPLNLTAQKLNLVFWLSVVIFPLGIVGFGLATWWKRR